MDVTGGLSKYRIGEKIGSGGMGEVYKAEDLALLRTVAIKMLAKHGGQPSDAELRFLREARAASSINHPGIVTIYEIGETDQFAYIVMEYVQGRSLRQLITTRSINAEMIKSISLQICDALAEAHARGIIHRDIKPENILFNDRGQVKLLDFGLAKSLEIAGGRRGGLTVVDTLTEAGAVMGTLSYMSPEQLRGEPLDQRTDLFSFGIVLHELITGDLPFLGSSSFDVAASILKDQASKINKVPEGLPRGVIKITARLLEKDKAKRYQSFADVKRDLEALEFDPVETSQPEESSESPPINESSEETKQEAVRPAASSLPSLKFTAPPTVLVLPLEVVGSADENPFIGIGLAQAITTDLARINGISVLSRTASTGSGDKSKGPREVARDLGATILLEGEVMRAGEVIGVMARLTDVETGRVIWGAQYRGDASDLFSMQDAVCEGVADVLKVGISNEVRSQIARPATVNLDAFEFYSKGQAFVERRDVKENIDYAVQMFVAALELDSDFALAYAGLGEAYWLKYQATRDQVWIERAIAASDHALALDPYQSQVHISLGIVYYETGRIERAIEEFERAASLQPANDSAHRWLGRCHLRRGDRESAITCLKKAIALRPGYWENYNRLGICYYTFGRYRDAAEQFRRVIMIQPDNNLGYSTLGGIYILLGLYEDAISMHQRAIAIYPNAASYTNLGTCHFHMGRFDEAIAAYKAAVEMDPREDIYHRNLGDAYLRVERAEEAKEEYARSRELIKDRLAVSPDNAELLGRLAVCQAKLGQVDEAIESIDRATAIEQRNTTLMYQKAVVYALAGRAEEAVEHLREALSSGYSPSEAERDPDLDALRERPEYASLFGGNSSPKR
jgi:serine/threonine protein kinase/tetratricopeptide (TPR) repeat protein